MAKVKLNLSCEIV